MLVTLQQDVIVGLFEDRLVRNSHRGQRKGRPLKLALQCLHMIGIDMGVAHRVYEVAGR